jgi:transcription termination factor NusB
MSNLDKFQTDRDSKLEKLFGDVPLETDMVVKLPTLGKFYPNGTPEVTISPIKFEDEKQLTINVKNGINPINLILSKCVNNVDSNSLLLIDKMLLLLKIREISYGETYPAKVNCPKCESESEINIDLSKLIIKYLPEDLADPREITLPKLKKKVKVRFPRVADEQFLNTQEQIYNNIWRFVTELDGSSDPVFISKAIPRMHIRDIKFILSHIMRGDLGLDPKFILQCGACGGESEMSVPINENFFSVI